MKSSKLYTLAFHLNLSLQQARLQSHVDAKGDELKRLSEEIATLTSLALQKDEQIHSLSQDILVKETQIRLLEENRALATIEVANSTLFLQIYQILLPHINNRDQWCRISEVESLLTREMG